MDASERQLWDGWKNRQDVAARDQLIAKHSDWARQVARSVYYRIYRHGGIWEDCAQNALVGLLESMDRFDPSRGIDFQLYARYRVRGSVFNGLRQLRSDAGVSRDDQAREQKVRERFESFADEEGDPLEAFVASAIGLGLGYLLDGQSVPAPVTTLDAYAATEAAQRDSAVSECIKLLPEKERLVLVLHYYHHLQFVQVAERLNVTKGRISQLHKQALQRLRQLLQDHWSELA